MHSLPAYLSFQLVFDSVGDLVYHGSAYVYALTKHLVTVPVNSPPLSECNVSGQPPSTFDCIFSY